MDPRRPRRIQPLGYRLAFCLLAGWTTQSIATPTTQTTEALGPVRVGETPPTFGGFAPDGHVVSRDKLLAEAKGPIVISFFATWCGPCRAGLVRMQDAVKARTDVTTLLVSFGEDADVAAPFLEQLGVTLPLLPDPYTIVGERLGVDKRLPRTFVLSADGVVRTIFTSEGDDFAERFQESLATASALRSAPVGGSAARAPATTPVGLPARDQEATSLSTPPLAP